MGKFISGSGDDVHDKASGSAGTAKQDGLVAQGSRLHELKKKAGGEWAAKEGKHEFDLRAKERDEQRAQSRGAKEERVR